MTEIAALPAEADLSDMKWMPLDIARLRRSKAWLYAKREPELGFYMINLWTASWHERPPGSLEDDDAVLCDAAMCDPRRWKKIRDKVLRGWVKSGARVYHPVVCEKALETWNRKHDYRTRLEKARAVKAASRAVSKTNNSPVIETAIDPLPERATGHKGQGQGQGQGQKKEEPSVPCAVKSAPLPAVQPGEEPVDYDLEFERWWLLMPKRDKHANPKQPAKAAWVRLVKRGAVSIDTLKAGARGYAAAMLSTGTEPRGVAQAITWLNQARWEQYAPATVLASAANGESTPVVALGLNLDVTRRALAKWRDGEVWPKYLGAAPGEPGCKVPADLLAEFMPVATPPVPPPSEEILF